MKKVILAYSGGLDTSVAVKWLKDKGFTVAAYMSNVGQEANIPKIRKRARAAGAAKFIYHDLKKEFVRDFVWPTLKAGAIYEDRYYLATALSRPLIAKGLVETAHKEKAHYVAHGCTGKGNDQVRFEVTINILDPKLKVIAPVREWELPTRDAEIRYAKMHKIPLEVTKKSPYSIDENVWGTSIECGVLEDPWKEPPEGAYRMTAPPARWPKKAEVVKINFLKGIPVSINGKRYDGLALIDKLNKIGGRHGIGRTDLVENRLIGIKSREIYEAPAAAILHEAQKDLESLVMDRELLHFKRSVSAKYAELVYYGLWYTPLKKVLDKLFDATQSRLTGEVKIKLYKGRAVSIGRKSVNSLYKKALATYGTGDIFDQSLAKGFIQLWGLPYRKG